MSETGCFGVIRLGWDWDKEYKYHDEVLYHIPIKIQNVPVFHLVDIDGGSCLQRNALHDDYSLRSYMFLGKSGSN